MDKKRIFGVAALLFLFGWLVVNVFLTFTESNASTGASKQETIRNLNIEKSMIEIRISELKPVCAELDQARAKRGEIENKINDAINGLFQPERK